MDTAQTSWPRRIAFALAQIVWGFPQTLAGLIVYLIYLDAPSFPYHGAIVTRWPRANSVSLGMFIFVTASIVEPDRRLKMAKHEYGHCIQSLIFGPLYLIVIGLPSFIWAMLPVARRWRTRNAHGYYHFFTERFANYLAKLVLG